MLYEMRHPEYRDETPEQRDRRETWEQTISFVEDVERWLNSEHKLDPHERSKLREDVVEQLREMRRMLGQP